jgi:hypothetical protein
MKDALYELSCSLQEAVSQLSDADAPAMVEVLEKLQEYDGRFGLYGLQQLQRPIAALQKELDGSLAAAGDEDDEDCSEEEKEEEEDDVMLRMARDCAGYQGYHGKRRRAW